MAGAASAQDEASAIATSAIAVMTGVDTAPRVRRMLMRRLIEVGSLLRSVGLPVRLTRFTPYRRTL